MKHGVFFDRKILRAMLVGNSGGIFDERRAFAISAFAEGLTFGKVIFLEKETTLLVKRVRELPNGNILLEKRLYFLSESDIIELRKKMNWVKDEKGRFAGSVPMGGGGAVKKDLTDEKERDIMDLEKLPVNIPPEKFTKYALDPIKQPDKARAFREALGYTKANYQDLIDNINRNFDRKAMKYKRTNQDGDLYEYVMALTGANGKQANVLTAWINDHKKGELRLTTAHVTDKRVTKDDRS